MRVTSRRPTLDAMFGLWRIEKHLQAMVSGTWGCLAPEKLYQTELELRMEMRLWFLD